MHQDTPLNVNLNIDNENQNCKTAQGVQGKVKEGD
jgi:hypothetical protein